MPASPNQGWTYVNRVDPNGAGESVLIFYARRYPHSTEDVWRDRIDRGLISVNGETVRPERRLATGDRLTYHRPPWVEPPVPTNIRVRHVDDQLLIIDKPAGLPVVSDAWHLRNTLLAMVRERFGRDTAPVHRLDRGTSGLVVFGRSGAARRCLSLDLESSRVRRVYRALVSGDSLPDGFVIDLPIGRIPYPPLRHLHVADPGGLPARTRGRVLHRDPAAGRAIVEIELDTGRPHQIRIHLSAAGHPLVGDPLYLAGGRPGPSAPGTGRPPLPGDGGYLLHATCVELPHPDGHRSLSVTSPPPPALLAPGERPSPG